VSISIFSYPSATRSPVAWGLLCALASFGVAAQAQTAPQLLPYTTKLIAGGSSTSYAAYTASNPVACSRTNSANTVLSASGNKATDIYGDGCLATEISLTGPRFGVMDKTGAIFFSDYTNGLIRRIDPVTGVVTAVAGGASSTPSGTTASPKACGGSDTNTSTDTLGDGCLGTSVKLGRPVGIAFSPAGDLYFADYYNYNVRKIAATNGVITGTGIISLADGNPGGADGFAANTSSGNVTAGSSSSYLRAVYGVAFDTAGNLYISDEYYYAVVVVNTNATGSTTVAGVTIPAGTEAKIVGTQKTTTTCTNGTASSSGCYDGAYVNGAQAGSSYLYNPYGISLDGNGNLFIADEEYGSVAEVNLSSGVLTNAAGLYSAVATTSPVTCPVGLCAVGAKPAQTERAQAGSFAIGSDYGVAADSNSNIYVTDALNGYVWRVDSGTQSMYVVAGGGATASVAGSPCPNAASFTATDTIGDGCPGLIASFSKSSSTCSATSCYASSGGIFGVTVDSSADLLIGDENNNVIREVASGTQFGSIGASQTDIVDIHFANGDSPIATGAYTITSGTGIFTLGAATCTANSDSTTDCLLPITAAPSAAGAFTGTLTVKSKLVSGSTSFPLSGNFVQSPVTRTAVTTSSSLSCTGVTYATGTPVILSASIVANGPVAPAGTITFSANNNTLGAAVPVTNLGTTAAPVYGATMSYTFANTGSYTITATFTPSTYFTASTSAPTAITVTAPTFAGGTTSYQYSTVVPGETALYSFTLAQTVYSGSISFACSGLPTGASCVFNPSTITASGCSATNTVALSILTTGPAVALSAFAGSGRGLWGAVSVLGGAGLALLIGLRRRRLPMRLGQLGMVLALLLASSGLIACNGSVNAPPSTPISTTPYNITITATGSTGTVSTFMVTLTVQ
jgi:hypothetical protein